MTDQSRYFVLPASELEEVRATIRREFPEALIGTKPQDDGSVVLVVTLYSDRPEGLNELTLLGADSVTVASAPPVRSLSDLVADIKRLQQQAP